MENKIIEGSYNDYLMLFGDFRTRQSDLSAKMATEGGKLYILLTEGVPSGFLALRPDSASYRIDYAFIVPEWRGKGLARKLFEHTLSNASYNIWISITESMSAVRHLAEKFGFSLNNKSTTFRSGIERDMSYWRKFMEEKGNRLNRVLKHMGFVAYSFREASPELLDKLYNSSNNEYGNPLDVKPFFDIKGRCLSRGLSFLAVHQKDGKEELAAYCLVSHPDNRSAIFEQTSAAAKYQNTGCVFLPISCSMQVFQDMGLNRAAYTIYDDNDQANSFRRKIFERVTVFSHTTYHYIWKGNKNHD